MEIVDKLRYFEQCGKTLVVRNMCRSAAEEIERQKHRADVLAATIRELSEVVTSEFETKADFIARVRAVLGADPDARLTPNEPSSPAAEGSPSGARG